MTREWILRMLRGLPFWVWPVFLWEVACFQVWFAGLKPKARTLITIGVTWSGRIEVLGLYEGERPRETDWTRHAPRAPWTALDPETISERLAALAGLVGLSGHDTGMIPPRYCPDTLLIPEILDSS